MVGCVVGRSGSQVLQGMNLPLSSLALELELETIIAL